MFHGAIISHPFHTHTLHAHAPCTQIAAAARRALKKPSMLLQPASSLAPMEVFDGRPGGGAERMAAALARAAQEQAAAAAARAVARAAAAAAAASHLAGGEQGGVVAVSDEAMRIAAEIAALAGGGGGGGGASHSRRPHSEGGQGQWGHGLTEEELEGLDEEDLAELRAGGALGGNWGGVGASPEAGLAAQRSRRVTAGVRRGGGGLGQLLRMEEGGVEVYYQQLKEQVGGAAAHTGVGSRASTNLLLLH